MTTNKSRRTLTTSVEGAREALSDSTIRVLWPEVEVARLPVAADAGKAMAVFKRVMSARAPGDWRQSDPIMAAQLANVTVELEKILEIVSRTGWTIESKGVQVPTPLMNPIQHLTTRQITLSRALGITGVRANAGAIDRAARKVQQAADVLEDKRDVAGLLAKPPKRSN